MYIAQRAEQSPPLDGQWSSPVWQAAQTAVISSFHPKSDPAHRPVTEARLLYDDEALHVIFHVEDRFVRCVNLGYQAHVHLDSCVEFFFAPQPGSNHYFNFEANCGGSLCFKYGKPLALGPRKPIPEELGRLVGLYHSLPSRVDPEIAGPIEWVLQARIPLAVIEAMQGPLGPLAGQQWTGNFYKCGNETRHPHWGSWSPVEGVLDFHRPEVFGPITFAP